MFVGSSEILGGICDDVVGPKLRNSVFRGLKEHAITVQHQEIASTSLERLEIHLI